MSSQSIARKLESLRAQMAQAALAEDFETAARLRDAIAALEGPEVRQPPPGAMGLGTHLPVAGPPKGWKKPRKPDPLTSGKGRRG